MTTDSGTTAQPLDNTGSFSEDVYRDRSNGRRRTFTLSGDRLIIESKQFLGTQSESTILLRDINPLYSTVRVLSPTVGAGLLVVTIMVTIAVLLPYVGTPTGPAPNLWKTLTHGPMGICFGVSVLFAILDLRNIRRIEHYEFTSRSLRFNIARNGSDRNRFDAFIARLLARVHEAKHPVPAPTPARSNGIPHPPPGNIEPGTASQPTKEEPQIPPESTGPKD